MLGNTNIALKLNLRLRKGTDHGALTPWLNVCHGRKFVVMLSRGLLPIILVTAAFLVRAANSNSDPDKFQRNRFSHIRGMTVENYDGEKLGTLSDLIVSLQTGTSQYAIIQSRGFAGLRSARRIVPAHLLSSATIKRNVLELDVSLQKWKDAPRSKKNELAALQNPRRAREIARFYRGSTQPTSPSPTGPPAQAAAAQSPKGSETKKRPDAIVYDIANEVVGRKVYDRQNEQLGEISDLLVDFSGTRPCVAIVSNRKETLAVSLRALSGTRSMKLDVSRAEVMKAPLFTPKIWQSSWLDRIPIYVFAD